MRVHVSAFCIYYQYYLLTKNIEKKSRNQSDSTTAYNTYKTKLKNMLSAPYKVFHVVLISTT